MLSLGGFSKSPSRLFSGTNEVWKGPPKSSAAANQPQCPPTRIEREVSPLWNEGFFSGSDWIFQLWMDKADEQKPALKSVFFCFFDLASKSANQGLLCDYAGMRYADLCIHTPFDKGPSLAHRPFFRWVPISLTKGDPICELTKKDLLAPRSLPVVSGWLQYICTT